MSVLHRNDISPLVAGLVKAYSIHEMKFGDSDENVFTMLNCLIETHGSTAKVVEFLQNWLSDFEAKAISKHEEMHKQHQNGEVNLDEIAETCVRLGYGNHIICASKLSPEQKFDLRKNIRKRMGGAGVNILIDFAFSYSDGQSITLRERS